MPFAEYSLSDTFLIRCLSVTSHQNSWHWFGTPVPEQRAPYFSEIFPHLVSWFIITQPQRALCSHNLAVCSVSVLLLIYYTLNIIIVIIIRLKIFKNPQHQVVTAGAVNIPHTLSWHPRPQIPNGTVEFTLTCFPGNREPAVFTGSIRSIPHYLETFSQCWTVMKTISRHFF